MATVTDAPTPGGVRPGRDPGPGPGNDDLPAPPTDPQALIEEARAVRRARLRRRRRNGALVALVVAAAVLGVGWGAGVPPFPQRGQGVGAGSVSAAPGRAGGRTTWALASSFSPQPLLSSITCPSASVCWAAGTVGGGPAGIRQLPSLLYRSTDGGTRWQSVAMPSMSDSLDGTGPGLDCPSVSHCVAISLLYSPVHGVYATRIALAASSDGGRRWSMHLVQARHDNGPLSLSCPGGSDCLAVAGSGSTGLVESSSDGGADWSRLAPLPATVSDPLVSCPSPARCVAVGTATRDLPVALTSTDFGRTWTQHALPTGPGWTDRLACPSVSVCVAIGRLVYVSRDGGASWTTVGEPAALRQVLDQDDGDVTLACASATTCVVTAPGPGRTATTFRTYRTHDDFATITSSTTAQTPGVYPPAQLTCPTTRVCLGAGPTGRISIRAGGAWRALPATTLGTSISAHALTCAGPSTCALGGSTAPEEGETGNAAVLSSDDGGQTWHETVDAEHPGIRSMACSGAQRCLALLEATGTGGLTSVVSTDSGRTWGDAHPVFGTTAASKTIVSTSLACPTRTVCDVVGTTAPGAPGTGMTTSLVLAATDDGGTSWHRIPAPTIPPGQFVDAALACPSTQWCVLTVNGYFVEPSSPASSAPGADVYVTRNAGGTWQQAALPGSVDALSASCTRTGACVGPAYTYRSGPGSQLTSTVLRSTDHGSTWAAVGRLPGHVTVQLRCATRTACVALAPSGAVFTSSDGGSHWSADGHLPVSGTLTSTNDGLPLLTCPSASACVAAGTAADGVTDVLRGRP